MADGVSEQLKIATEIPYLNIEAGKSLLNAVQTAMAFKLKQQEVGGRIQQLQLRSQLQEDELKRKYEAMADQRDRFSQMMDWRDQNSTNRLNEVIREHNALDAHRQAGDDRKQKIDDDTIALYDELKTVDHSDPNAPALIRNIELKHSLAVRNSPMAQDLRIGNKEDINDHIRKETDSLHKDFQEQSDELTLRTLGPNSTVRADPNVLLDSSQWKKQYKSQKAVSATNPEGFVSPDDVAKYPDLYNDAKETGNEYAPVARDPTGRPIWGTLPASERAARMNRYKALNDRAFKLPRQIDDEDVKPGVPSSAKVQLDSATAREILNEAKGDKNKAREIARQRGYQL